LERGINQNLDFAYYYVPLTAAYAQAGRSADASRTAAVVRRLIPFFDIHEFGKDFRNLDDRARLAEGLRKAGLK
jgi:hypothetical protein